MAPPVDPRTLPVKLPPLQLFIGGKFVSPVEGGTIPVVNPATGEKICDAPAAGAKDVDLAVQAAKQAFESGPWPKLSPTARGRAIRKFADLLFQRREEFAVVESLNNGSASLKVLPFSVILCRMTEVFSSTAAASCAPAEPSYFVLSSSLKLAGA